MNTLTEGLIFAVLVISVAIGWLLWQRHLNRFEVPNGADQYPAKKNRAENERIAAG